MVGVKGQKLSLKGEVWENYYRLKDERGLKQKRQEEQVRFFESFNGIAKVSLHAVLGQKAD